MRVYLIEDEENILKHLASVVSNDSRLKQTGYSDSVEKAKKEIPLLDPELILADIKLNDGNSFEVFNSIDTDAHIVFITAYEQYAIDALNLGALGYLLKPLELKLFSNVIERCLSKAETFRFNKQQMELSLHHYDGTRLFQKIALKSSAHTLVVNVSEILYCISSNGYTTFHLQNDRPFMVSRLIKDYEMLLPGEIFIRCHQSYLVNVNHIHKFFKEGYIEMMDGTRIPISARKKSFVQDFIDKMS